MFCKSCKYFHYKKTQYKIYVIRLRKCKYPAINVDKHVIRACLATILPYT